MTAGSSLEPPGAGVPTERAVRASAWRKYAAKMRGNKRLTPLAQPVPLDIIVSALGSLVGIGVVAFVSLVYGKPLIVASFGASAVLVYGVPDAPLSQPRNVLGGHLLSSAAGVLTYMACGLTWWSATLATTLAIVIMMLTKTTHPPGGATALYAVLSRANPTYILAPVLLGAAALVVIGVLVNNLSPNRSYPRYWL